MRYVLYLASLATLTVSAVVIIMTSSRNHYRKAFRK